MLKGKNYCITIDNVLLHEIIGLSARVSGSTDLNKIGIRGKIVDETKNTIVIETRKGEKVVPKKEAVIEVLIGEEKAVLDGSKIVFRPEERTKKLWRKRHAAAN